MDLNQNQPMQNDTAELSNREILRQVYLALMEKGYNPIGQLVGYLLSEDPTYITNSGNARTLIRRLDRDELMHEMLEIYLELN